MAHPGVQLTELLDGALASASDRRLVRRVRSLLDAFKSASGAYPRRWRTRGGFEESGCDLVARCAVRAPLAGVLGLLVDALGVDPNAATPGGLSLLHLAAAYDNADAVVALLGRGAVHAEDARGRTPLDLARAYAFIDARARAEAEASGDEDVDRLLNQTAPIFAAIARRRASDIETRLALVDGPWVCFGCGAERTEAPVPHPAFSGDRVPVCRACLRTYNQGAFDIEDGHEVYCRGCGDGGELILCDGCPRAACAPCAERNFGSGHVKRARAGEWYCPFACRPSVVRLSSLKRRWYRVFDQYDAVLRATAAAAIDPRRAILSADLSGGLERFRVRCVGPATGDRPPPFEYARSYAIPGAAVIERRRRSAACACRRAAPRNYDADGCVLALPVGGAPIYECGDACGCPASCGNRVVGHGSRVPFEIFPTPGKGFGARSRARIVKHEFVAAYTGELLTSDEAEARGADRGDEYFLGLDYHEASPLSARDGNAKETAREPLVVDAKWRGNASRFFNNSCSPNLRGRVVFVDGDTPTFALFARRDIPPGVELTWDYKLKNGAMVCECGYANCRGEFS